MQTIYIAPPSTLDIETSSDVGDDPPSGYEWHAVPPPTLNRADSHRSQNRENPKADGNGERTEQPAVG